MNIEDVAAENPDAITYEPIDIMAGITEEQICRVIKKVWTKAWTKVIIIWHCYFNNFCFFQIGLEDHIDEALGMIKKMYDLFLKKDALLIEINPYAEDALTGNCKFWNV